MKVRGGWELVEKEDGPWLWKVREVCGKFERLSLKLLQFEEVCGKFERLSLKLLFTKTVL